MHTRCFWTATRRPRMIIEKLSVEGLRDDGLAVALLRDEIRPRCL